MSSFSGGGFHERIVPEIVPKRAALPATFKGSQKRKIPCNPLVADKANAVYGIDGEGKRDYLTGFAAPLETRT